jgi:hypothetical protein
LIVVMCALLLAACAKKAEVSQSTSAPEGAASEASPAAQTSPQAAAAGSQVLELTLSAMKGSEISGTATFTQSDAGTRVQVDLTGAGSTGELAAQIRSGTCADPGQIDVADTWQLSGGKADAPTFTNIGQLTAKPTVVVIIPMAAPAGSPGIFSCGQTTH